MDYYQEAGLLPYLEEAQLPPGRLRLHHLHRKQRAAAGRRRRQPSQGEARGRAVLSGNRNFEGRINPLVRANYLASPPLVVAYALAGTRRHRPRRRSRRQRARTASQVYLKRHLADARKKCRRP